MSFASNNWNQSGGFGSAGANNATGNTGSTQSNPLSFASAPSGGSLFGNSSRNNLFDNSGSNTATAANNAPGATSGGLFGNSGGLFGNSSGINSNNVNTTNSNTSNFNSNNGSNTLFGNSNTQNTSAAPNLTSNPFNYDPVISNIPTNETLPSSVTASLFPEPLTKKRAFSATTAKPKSTLLGILGRTLKLFRAPTTTLDIKGLFTASNFNTIKRPDANNSRQILRDRQKTFKGKSLRTTYSARGVGSVKRLVIKSKPLNFHLIDADKVLNTKRRRIITHSELSSDDDSDIEPPNVGTSGTTKIQNIFGESVKSSNTEEDDPDNKDLNNGYWCTPTIAELSRLSPQQSTKVQNFIIGRVGFGQVAFDYPVDLTHYIAKAQKENTTLNRILFERKFVIGTKHIRTLPDQNDDGEDIKSAIGFGVNVPATLTLENVSPPQKTTSSADFIKYLQHQPGSEFVTYDPITHKWIFKVKHFSVWGLIDDISAEDGVSNLEELRKLKRKQDDEESHSNLELSRIYEKDRLEAEIRNHKFAQHSRGVPGGFSFNVSREGSPLQTKRDLVAQEISSRLDKYEENKKREKELDITIDSESEKSVNFAQKEGAFDYLKQAVSILPENTNLDDIVDEKAYEPEITDVNVFDNIQIKSNLAVSRDWLVQLELSNDINSALNPLVQRKASSLDLDEMLFSEFNRKATQVEPQQIELEEIEEDDEFIYPNNIPRLVQIMIGNSAITVRRNGYPLVEQVSPQAFSEFLSTDLILEEEEQVKLLSALFDKKLVPGSSQVNDIAMQERLLILNERQVFGDWLRFYNNSLINELFEKNSDSFERVFVLLLGGELSRAVELAYETGNAHLAAALTTADSGEPLVQSIARNQLEEWKLSSAAVSPALIKIYRIISGDLAPLLAELPWNLSLAIELFYGGNSLSIGDLLLKIDTETSSPILDILRLYHKSNIDSIVDSGLNIKWQWITFKVLQKNKQFSASIFDDLTLKFGSYLEKWGLWKDAIYVHSHLSEDSVAKSQLRQLVIGNVQDINSGGPDEVQELVEVYKIPRNLINEAVSIDNLARGDIWGQCRSLVQAEMWQAAHDTISRTLGPQVTLSNNSRIRQDLMRLLAQFPPDQDITGWNNGAGIYENYFKLLENTDSATVQILLDIIPGAKDNQTFETKTALKLISKKVGDLTLERLDEIPQAAARIEKLFLGEAEQTYFKLRLNSLTV